MATSSPGYCRRVATIPRLRRSGDTTLERTRTWFEQRVASAWSSEQSRIPAPDAIVIALATFNTINEWVQGIADTYALGILCEYLCTAVPQFVIPYMKRELARHPALVRSVRLLKRHGVEAVKATRTSSFDSGIPWESVSRHLTMATVDKRAR